MGVLNEWEAEEIGGNYATKTNNDLKGRGK